jgi:hypothetical protein
MRKKDVTCTENQRPEPPTFGASDGRQVHYHIFHMSLFLFQGGKVIRNNLQFVEMLIFFFLF